MHGTCRSLDVWILELSSSFLKLRWRSWFLLYWGFKMQILMNEKLIYSFNERKESINLKIFLKSNFPWRNFVSNYGLRLLKLSANCIPLLEVILTSGFADSICMFDKIHVFSTINKFYQFIMFFQYIQWWFYNVCLNNIDTVIRKKLQISVLEIGFLCQNHRLLATFFWRQNLYP